MIEPRVRAADIARAGDFSRAFVSQVLAGDAKPSPRFVEACRKLGLPVDVLFGVSPDSGKGSRELRADPSPESASPALAGDSATATNETMGRLPRPSDTTLWRVADALARVATLREAIADGRLDRADAIAEQIGRDLTSLRTLLELRDELVDVLGSCLDLAAQTGRVVTEEDVRAVRARLLRHVA
jgi:transcriptional regulator with XRE-family HTH domain